MRKLSPYDDLHCFCEIKPTLTLLKGGGKSMTSGQKCECLATPAQSLPRGLKTVKQFESWQKSKRQKMTRFKVGSISTNIPEVVHE